MKPAPTQRVFIKEAKVTLVGFNAIAMIVDK